MKAKKLEAGQGGKKGHSNMSHWDGTEIIKEKTKRALRQVDRMLSNPRSYSPFSDPPEHHEKFA